MYDERKKKAELSILLRKFYRDVQQNRILSEAKRRQYVEKKVSRTKRRSAAIRKNSIKKILRGY